MIDRSIVRDDCENGNRCLPSSEGIKGDIRNDRARGFGIGVIEIEIEFDFEKDIEIDR